MRFHSTPQSALDGEITILAIIETIVSVAIYVGIGLYFGTFKYLAWAVVAALPMLLRTEASAEWGFSFYVGYRDLVQNYLNRAEHYNSFKKVIFTVLTAVVGILAMPVVGTAIRIIAILNFFVRMPLQSLKEVPRNWLRQSFCTDFFHQPEIIPLEAIRGKSARILTFDSLLSGIREDRGLLLKLASLLMYLPAILTGYLPSMLYRISFKATAVSYLPFIWVVHATLRNPLPAKLRLERLTKGELEKVRRMISLFIITILTAKIALVWGGWLEQSFIESKFPSKKLAESIVAFGSWPWWQFTLLADSLLTFFLLFFADAALGRIDSPHAWKEERTLGAVSAISFLRAVLALATIGHFFYIALRVVAPKSLQAFL